jgi:hypothetical protein
MIAEERRPRVGHRLILGRRDATDRAAPDGRITIAVSIACSGQTHSSTECAATPVSLRTRSTASSLRSLTTLEQLLPDEGVSFSCNQTLGIDDRICFQRGQTARLLCEGSASYPGNSELVPVRRRAGSTRSGSDTPRFG